MATEAPTENEIEREKIIERNNRFLLLLRHLYTTQWTVHSHKVVNFGSCFKLNSFTLIRINLQRYDDGDELVAAAVAVGGIAIVPKA